MNRRFVLSIAVILACSSCRSRPAPSTVPFNHGSRDVAEVALTFDACSSARDNRLDEGVLEGIEKAGIPATIFLGGMWMERQPDAVRRMAASRNLELGLHGWDHRRLAKLTDGEFRAHLGRSRELFQRLTGMKPYLFRPPFAVASPRDLALAAEAGYLTVNCDLPAGDSDPKFTRDVLTRHVVRSARNGSVIIFHINGRGRATAEALPGIIAGLHARGFTLVTVGRLASRNRPASRR